MKALNRQNISPVPERPVKVLQFGEGNFLRGFVDWIIDTLNDKTDFNGDIQLVQPIDKGLGEMINKQDGLYHVQLSGIQKGVAKEETKLITCVRGVNNPYEDYEAYLKLAENPDLRFIISNTTEAGISYDPKDDTSNKLSNSFPGKLTALLYRRYNTFNGSRDKGLHIIPCELIDKNGEKLKEIILQYAQLWDLPKGFVSWIQEANTFSNTLVDRIVPGFPKETIKEIQEEIGFEDNLVVKAEPFHLWVIEGPENLKDEFPTEKAGLDVLFVKDQSPYRTRKVRILNGAHTSLVPVAYLNGLRTVRESVEDPEVGEFIKSTIQDEIIPTLDLPKEELEQFANDVLDRFKNPFVKHLLSAIALNSISKFKVRVLPSLLEYINRKNELPKNLVHSLAALILFYKGQYNGEETPVNDSQDIMDFFAQVWESDDAKQVAHQVLANKSLWDQDLSQVNGLEQAVAEQILVLAEKEKV
ncbi:tagaturonate reductase [Echinicola jeungdonensis]|uniref:Tagaturonate reductase n=1 Tax=Echinicola jeungdonensis TaxID=709343 RepID=A0ABV5J4X2_9BACT|nr:tagaturonate reductase [Echinicola jeungdonensis]MDN3670620.1 tagaturonate reductase [Echinicola jeungdonensis]